MLYPSIQDLTNDEVNRYMLVIAAAKSARYVTYKANQDMQGREGEKTVSIEESSKKSVSIAVDKLHGGQFTIIKE